MILLYLLLLQTISFADDSSMEKLNECGFDSIEEYNKVAICCADTEAYYRCDSGVETLTGSYVGCEASREEFFNRYMEIDE